MSNDEKKGESTEVLKKLNQIEGKVDAMTSNTLNNFIYMLALTILILSTNLYLNLKAFPTSTIESFALSTFIFGFGLLAYYFYRTNPFVKRKTK